MYVMVDQSPKKILVLLRKPRKSRHAKEIITLMRGLMTTTSSNEDHNSIWSCF